jgi:hypothetical protein
MVLCKLGPAAPKVHLTATIIVHFNLIWGSSSIFFAKDSFTKLTPVHELGKFQQNTLLLTALCTSDTEERVNLVRRRRRGVARSNAGTLGNGGRYLGIVLTSQGVAEAPFHRCGRRGHQGGVLQFVLTATGTAVPPLLHQGTSVKVDSTASAIGRVCLVKRNPDEIWRRKTMRRRRLTMKGLGFSLASWCTLFISNFLWTFMNYRSN